MSSEITELTSAEPATLTNDQPIPSRIGDAVIPVVSSGATAATNKEVARTMITTMMATRWPKRSVTTPMRPRSSTLSCETWWLLRREVMSR